MQTLEEFEEARKCKCNNCRSEINLDKGEYFAIVKFEPETYTRYIESNPRFEFCSSKCLTVWAEKNL